MAAYQGGAFPYGIDKAGSHATDAATNTEDTLTLGAAPSPCSSSSSLASLLLTQEGGRAGGPPTAPGAGLTPPPVGVGAGKVGMRTRAAPEESVPSSEIDLLLAQQKEQEQEQEQPPRRSSRAALKHEGGGKVLEEEEGEGEGEGEASTHVAGAGVVVVIPTSPAAAHHPRHRRNNAEWLRAVHVAAFVGAEITAEEAAVLRSLAFGMGAASPGVVGEEW